MDKDIEKEIDASNEEEATIIPEQAKQQMENYLSIKEKERETKEAIHKENMKVRSNRNSSCSFCPEHLV